MELSERLKACLKVETLCEEIYYSLCVLFPEAKGLFQKLAEEEERHADILTICAGFQDMGALPDMMVLNSLPQITKSIDIAEEIKARIAEEDISLLDALHMTLELEDAVAEIYFNEVMTEKSDMEVIAYLQQFYKNEISHMQRIEDFIHQNFL
jgi:rubrerythrin